jgi:hypothetical protein
VFTATTTSTPGMLTAATSTTGVTTAATALLTDKRYDTGIGIAFQDRHRGCLCRTRCEKSGEHASRKRSRHQQLGLHEFNSFKRVCFMEERQGTLRGCEVTEIAILYAPTAYPTHLPRATA